MKDIRGAIIAVLAASAFGGYAGVAAGADGIFMEVHDNPSQALSDSSNALDLKRFKPLARKLRDLGRFVRKLD